MKHFVEAVEAAARALCEQHGGAPDKLHNGRPFWEHYVPDAEAALRASGLLDMIESIKLLVPEPDDMPGKALEESTRARLFLDVTKLLYPPTKRH